MASYNRVILIGNLTRDPELRYIPSGTAVCEIGLAVNDRRKGPNGDWIEETTFVDITLWGRTAEVCSEYCTKGSPLFVEGRLKYDQWEKEGKKMSKLRVVADKIQFMGGRGGEGGPSGGGGARGGQAGGRSRPQQQPSGPSYDEADYGAPADVGSYGGGAGGGGDEIPF